MGKKKKKTVLRVTSLHILTSVAAASVGLLVISARGVPSETNKDRAEGAIIVVLLLKALSDGIVHLLVVLEGADTVLAAVVFTDLLAGVLGSLELVGALSANTKKLLLLVLVECAEEVGSGTTSNDH